MQKDKLLLALIGKLEADLIMTKEAARISLDAATNEESKPENEYDTRALEASYLAGAQAKRAAEIDEALSIFRQIKLKNFGSGDPVAPTAYVEIKSNNKVSSVFIMPAGGGQSVQFEDKLIQVITPSSILGGALLGLKQGEIAEIENSNQIREYEVLRVLWSKLPQKKNSSGDDSVQPSPV